MSLLDYANQRQPGGLEYEKMSVCYDLDNYLDSAQEHNFVGDWLEEQLSFFGFSIKVPKTPKYFFGLNLCTCSKRTAPFKTKS